MITAIDQIASRIHGIPSEASDSHNRNVEDVAGSKKGDEGKATKRFYLKVMKARQPTSSITRVPGVETCHSLLEEYVYPEYKEELF